MAATRTCKDYTEDLKRLKARLDVEIEALGVFETRAHNLLIAYKPPPGAIAFVEEAVRDKEVTSFNFRKWITSKFPNFFCGPSRGQLLDAFSLVFGLLVAWNALNMDQGDPDDLGTCSRNGTWPPPPEHLMAPQPEHLLAPQPEQFSALRDLTRFAAQPKDTSVVEEVFAKAKRASPRGAS